MHVCVCVHVYMYVPAGSESLDIATGLCGLHVGLPFSAHTYMF